MPIGYGKLYGSADHQKILKQLKDRYPDMEEDHKVHGYGPAVYYWIPGFQGSIGLISALHGKFCHSCNRVRLTSQGYLKSCLCYEDGADLKKILQSGKGREETERELLAVMRQVIGDKPGEHCFPLRADRHSDVPHHRAEGAGGQRDALSQAGGVHGTALPVGVRALADGRGGVPGLYRTGACPPKQLTQPRKRPRFGGPLPG